MPVNSPVLGTSGPGGLYMIRNSQFPLLSPVGRLCKHQGFHVDSVLTWKLCSAPRSAVQGVSLCRKVSVPPGAYLCRRLRGSRSPLFPGSAF